MHGYLPYRKKTVAYARPYVPGEDLEGVSISDVDKPPVSGGMIFINTKNPQDRWYVAPRAFRETYAPAEGLAWRFEK